MSLTSFLFEGSVPPAIVKTANATSSLPPWFQEYQKGLVAKADALATQPYQGFGGPRLEQFTPEQLEAWDMTRANVGAGTDLLNQATSATGAASNPSLDAGVFGSYMTPYMEGVVNRIGELGERNLTERLLPNVQDEFIRSGQFGSSRHGDFAARALRDTGESILGQQAQALQAGHEAAMSNYQTAMNRQLTGGGNLAALAKQLQTMGLTDAAAMEAIGQTQQQQGQKGLDIAYQDFVEQREYPKTNVNWINAILQGQQLPTSTTQVSTQPAGYTNPSPLQSFIGMTSALGGLRRGGRVRRYAGGGKVIPFPKRHGGAISRCMAA